MANSSVDNGTADARHVAPYPVPALKSDDIVVAAAAYEIINGLQLAAYMRLFERQVNEKHVFRKFLDTHF